MRGTRFVAALTIAFAASGGTAWGDSVVLGPPDLSGFTANAVGCQASDPDHSASCSLVVANLAPPAGVALTVPDDGTVTAWRGKGNTNLSTQQSLVVLRPQGGGTYALAGQSTNGNIDGTANSTSLPVQPGDVLGAALSCTSGAGALVCISQLYSQQPQGATYGLWTPASLPGPPLMTDTRELGLNATVNVASPVVTSITPASGGVSGGDTITITGQHLANATAVTFGSPVANIVSNTNSQVVVKAPQHDPLTVHVQVITAGGTSAISSADQYTYVPERKLTVSVNGSGTVTGNGISCPGDCSKTYLDGTGVSLSAAPSSGSSFGGWGGACSGTGGCQLTMGADHDVSATFTGNPPPPNPPNTRISQATIDSAKGKAKFKFKAVGSANGFQCALKRKRRGAKPPRFKACTSPKTYKRLKPGKYVFFVRADGPGGPDSTPAKKRFKIG